jgi:hypothetical protein
MMKSENESREATPSSSPNKDDMLLMQMQETVRLHHHWLMSRPLSHPSFYVGPDYSETSCCRRKCPSFDEKLFVTLRGCYSAVVESEKIILKMFKFCQLLNMLM